MSDPRDTIERLTNRLNLRVWKTSISYTPKGGTPTITTPTGGILYGVFDSAYLVTVEIDGMQINDRKPMLEIVLEDLVNIPQRGDRYTLLSGRFAGQKYTVIETHFDGFGAVMLQSIQGDHA